ncbi:PilZ domain-containing protein [Mesorhizobium sp. A556]
MTDIVREFRMHAQGEKRVESRQRALKRGVLTFFGGYCTCEATVRSLSPSGARLDFDDTDGVPEVFSLAVGEGNVVRMARVRWRSQHSLGVQFINADARVHESAFGG